MTALRRVVVTGIGAQTPLGLTFVDSWKALLAGQCGLSAWEPTDELSRRVSCRVVGRVPVETTVEPRCVPLAVAAAREALEQAQLLEELLDSSTTTSTASTRLQERTGVSIGTGLSSVSLIRHTERIGPHFVTQILPNTPASRISMEFHCRGPNLSSSTACAASAHALGDAYHWIRNGLVDVMLAGGTEACVDSLTMASFSKMRALSTISTPLHASRPFDRDRCGFVLSEGSAVLVLEDYQHALARGVPILAELVGYGATADAVHATQPSGQGAVRAMHMALSQQRQVDYVNAHATSTPLGDAIEAQAIAQVCPHGPVSSTKGGTGHLLGAAGALEAAIVVQALVDQVLPATLNLERLDDDDRLQHIRQTQAMELTVALSNSFGFGGTNASLAFERIE